MTFALVLLAAGVALVLLALPDIGDEVVVGEEFTVAGRRTTLGPYDLPWGSYTVWMEDHEDVHWVVFIRDLDTDEVIGTVRPPEEDERRELEGVDCRLVHNYLVPGGEYDLVLECSRGDPNGTTQHVFLVRSTPPLAETALAVGGLLVLVGITVAVYNMRRGSG